ncbi:MAG: MATE family efflux transporter [Bdellovibrionales bacterium]|nr:MATE family efflux transporter [Bdellovibrionales bacterium]
MMTKNHKDLTQGSVAGHLLSLSGPMFLGLFAIFFFGVTDAYFLGKLGSDALAAMGFVIPVMAVFMSLSRGMSEGAISLVSRKLGALDMEDAKIITTSILVLSFLIVLLFVLLGVFLDEFILTFLGANGVIHTYANEYLTVWFAGMVFLVIPMVGNGFIRAAGDTRWPAMLMVFSAIANIILDPIFIFGWGWIPAFGVKGAAIASILARSFTLFAALYLVQYRYQMVSFSGWSWPKVVKIWRDFIGVSIPAGLNFMIIPMTIAMITRLMAQFTSNHVAGFGLAHQIETLSLLVFYAVAVGMSSFVGQNFGAKQWSRLKSAFSVVTKVNLICSVVLVVFFFYFATPIARLFQTQDTIVHIASSYLLVVSVSFGFEGIYLFCVNSLNVTGHALWATFLVFFRMLLLYMPIAYYLAPKIGPSAVFYAAILSNVLSGIVGRLLLNHKIIKPNYR